MTTASTSADSNLNSNSIALSSRNLTATDEHDPEPTNRSTIIKGSEGTGNKLQKTPQSVPVLSTTLQSKCIVTSQSPRLDILPLAVSDGLNQVKSRSTDIQLPNANLQQNQKSMKSSAQSVPPILLLHINVFLIQFFLQIDITDPNANDEHNAPIICSMETQSPKAKSPEPSSSGSSRFGNLTAEKDIYLRINDDAYIETELMEDVVEIGKNFVI